MIKSGMMVLAMLSCQNGNSTPSNQLKPSSGLGVQYCPAIEKRCADRRIGQKRNLT
jgi:hypothetical protein